jgi:hypothetical protein
MRESRCRMPDAKIKIEIAAARNAPSVERREEGAG